AGGGSTTVSANVFVAEASIGRATLAHVDEGATVSAGALNVLADASSMDAQATMTVGSAALGLSVGAAQATTTVTGNVEAYIGNQDGSVSNGLTTRIDTTSAVNVHASTDQARATSTADGGSGSLLFSAAAMVADATVAGSTKAYLGFLGAPTNGAHLSANGLDVEATEGTSAAIAKILVVNISIFGVGG